MAASAKFEIRSILTLPTVEGTGNQDRFDLLTGVGFDADTNTAVQIVFDPEDAISGDDQEAELQLMAPGGSVTVDNTTDVFTAGAVHGLSLDQEIRFTNSGGALPAPLVSGTSYYVESIPASTTFKLAEFPGGPVLNITTNGTGTHSWQAYGDVAVEYPYDAPSAPIRIMDRRDGLPNDFSIIRAVHLYVIPKDDEVDASGSGWITCGDPAAPENHFHLPWNLDYTAADPDADKLKPAAIVVLPDGIPYDTDYHLTLAVKAGESNSNLRMILNLLGK